MRVVTLIQEASEIYSANATNANYHASNSTQNSNLNTLNSHVALNMVERKVEASIGDAGEYMTFNQTKLIDDFTAVQVSGPTHHHHHSHNKTSNKNLYDSPESIERQPSQQQQHPHTHINTR